MGPDDVPPDEMHLFGLTRDPLDAALRGESDDPATTALVGDLRSAYLPEGTRTRSAALVAFAGTGDGAPAAITSPPRQVVVEPVVPLGRRVAVGVAAFAATITGKVVLGGAVAAAALGGLHAGEVVDVPLLPRSPQADVAPADVTEPAGPSDPLSVLEPPTPDGGETDRDVPNGLSPAPRSGTDAPAPVDPATPAEDITDPGQDTAPADPPSPAPQPPAAPRQPAGPPSEQPAPPADQPAPPTERQPPADGATGEDPGTTPPAGAPEEPSAPAGQPAPAEQPPQEQQEDPARP